MQRSKDPARAYLSHKSERGPVRGALLAFFFSLLASAILLIISAIVLSYATGGIPYIGLIGGALGASLAFFGGLAASKLGGRSGTLAGVLFGGLFLLILLLIGYLFPTGAHPLKRVIGYAVFLLLSVLGGALGGMRPKTRHKPLRRHR